MKNILAELDNIDFVSAVQSLVNRACIIDFGIVQKVVAKGIVDVSVAVANTEENIVCMTCVLGTISSDSFTVNIEPVVGDRVIVFYPRTYDDNMFTVPEEDSDKVKIIINKDAKGYKLLGGIAFLFNQFQTKAHRNTLDINNGNITYTTKDSDGNILNNILLQTDGTIQYTTTDSDGNQVNDLKLSADGTAYLKTKADNKDLHTWELKSDGVSLVSKSNNNTVLSLTATADGITLEDKNGAKIQTASDYTTINGRLKIKVK